MALRVYLSSTYEDLENYRKAVFKALERAGLQVARMEAYTADDKRPVDLCLNDVARADLYIGVFGWRYGYVPPAEHGNDAGFSITELEYRQAIRRHIPILPFLSHESTRETWPEKLQDDRTGEGEAGRRIAAFRAELGTEKMASFFTEPQQLATEVLAAILRSGKAKRPFLVPPLSAGFVRRERETAAIKHELLSQSSNAVALATAVHGAGGFGKTTLAKAVCHDPEVVAAFDGGVLWTELGQTPDIRAKLAELYRALCSDERELGLEFTSVDEARRAVAKLIAGKRALLLVVDDAWKPLHLKPFGELGVAHMLYTARNKELVATATPVEVDEMASEQAAALLARELPVDNGDPRFLDLAHRLGNWPLLLELANARLIEEFHARGTIEEALKHVVLLLSKRGVVSYDKVGAEESECLDVGNAEVRNQAVRLTLQAGFEGHSKAFSERACELGIFPDGTVIPVWALSDLWGCDNFTTEEDHLRPLDKMHVVAWNRVDGTVGLHDIVRAGLAALVCGLPAVHKRLVDIWGDPPRMPRDHEYAWRWFGWHCIEAGEHARLRRCLFDPEWLRAKLEAVGVAPMVSDCERLLVGQNSDKSAPREDNRPVELLANALRKSFHVLARYPDQLENQLLGRLLPGMSADLDGLIRRLQPRLTRQSLGARFPNLAPAGSPLSLTLIGHEDRVSGALLLPDGRVLSWSADHTLRLWDLATGTGQALVGHEGPVTGALSLPDGRALSWAEDRTLRLWDLATRDSRALIGHEDKVFGALALPDRRSLSWSRDCTMRLWDLATGESRALTGHSNWVLGALPLPDGRALSWSADGLLRLWDLTTGESRTLIGHNGWMSGAMLLPDGRALSWSTDHTMRLWNLATGESRALIGHDGWVSGALLLPDGRALSWSSDRTLRLWDLATGESRAFTGHGGAVHDTLLLADGRALSRSADCTLRLWDLATGESCILIRYSDRAVGALALADGGALSWSKVWSADRALWLWDLGTGERRPLIGHEDAVSGALALPGGRALSWSSDRTLRLWDLVATGESRTRIGHEDRVSGALSLDDGRALSWSADHTLRLWELATGASRALTGHKGKVSGGLLLPNGRALSWSADGLLRVWDLATGESRALIGHEDEVCGALPLPDGRALSWSADKTLRVWDLATGDSRALIGHGNAVLGALPLPDGRALSWSAEPTLQLWDLETGEGRALVGHKGAVSGALLLPDGHALSWSGEWSADRTLRLWDLATGKSRPLIGHKGLVSGALLLPNGSALSWCADANTLRLWDLATSQSRVLAGHEEKVSGALLLTERRALSWSVDHTLRLWDLATRESRALIGHDDEVRGALLLPDGQALSWSADNTLRVWRLEGEQEVGRYCCEGTPTVALLVSTNLLMVGDSIGTVYFLTMRLFD